MEVTEFRGRVYDQRHGGAFDRGSADSYYGRPRNPHYFEGDTHASAKINLALLARHVLGHRGLLAHIAFGSDVGDVVAHDAQFGCRSVEASE